MGWQGNCRCINEYGQQKRIYETKRAARKAVREIPRPEHCRAYQCPSNPRWWHLGHLPSAVLLGDVARSDYYQGRGRVARG